LRRGTVVDIKFILHALVVNLKTWVDYSKTQQKIYCILYKNEGEIFYHKYIDVSDCKSHKSLCRPGNEGVIHYTYKTQYLLNGLSDLHQIYDRPQTNFSQKNYKSAKIYNHSRIIAKRVRSRGVFQKLTLLAII
jgi:hypothetical protein